MIGGRTVRGEADPEKRRARRRERAELWRLAWPASLARAGVLLMAATDIAMVGRIGGGSADVELSFAALGNALFIPLLVTGIGALTGGAVLASQANGRLDGAEAGRALRRGLALAVTLGAALMLSMAGAGLFLYGIGQPPELADGGGAVAFALGLSGPFFLLYIACVLHLESCQRPLPGLVATALAVPLNAALNGVLIYGSLGAPALGAEGAAWSTTFVRAAMLIVVATYLFAPARRAAFGVTGRLRDFLFAGPFWGAGGWRAAAQQRRLGFAAAAASLAETSAFACLTFWAAAFGAVGLAAYSIAHNLLSLYFMAALGVGIATSVRVGRWIGAGETDGARTARGAGLLTVVGVSLAASALTLIAPGLIAALYTTDPAVAAATARLLPLIAALVLVDGLQLVAAAAVRGLGDAWASAARATAAFWGVMAPAGFVLAFWAEAGVAGLLGGAIMGCAANFWLQQARFRQVLEARPSAAAS